MPLEPQPLPYHQQSISDRAQEQIIGASCSTITPADDDPIPKPRFPGASPHRNRGFKDESITGFSDIEKRGKVAATPIDGTTISFNPLKATLSNVLNEYKVLL